MHNMTGALESYDGCIVFSEQAMSIRVGMELLQNGKLH